MTKETLRIQMIKKLSALSPNKRKSIEQKLRQHLIESPFWQEADTIGLTISQGIEWNTKPIIETAWEQGKTVVVPKCYPQEKRLIFYHLTSYDELEVVYYQLQEPIPSKTKQIDQDDINLLVVPGLVFNPLGYRIGFGGGYYDRFLVHFSHKTLSLLSSQQLVYDIPIEAHDIPVDHLISEQGILK